MNHLRVKICGITSVEDGLAACRAGADAVGLVLWPGSPRALDPARAREIAAALPPLVLRVGVFVDAPAAEIARAAETVGLDLVQLHGSEPPEAVAALPRRVLKAVRVGEGFRPEHALAWEPCAAGLLLDTAQAGVPGGTGRRFDWSHARSLRDRVRFLVLAGGLTPENVAEAIAAVRPDAVDVSSGVESAPGRKDPERMAAFVAAARGGLA